MTNSQLSDKIYEVLEEKCEEFKEYRLWCQYLESHAIRARDYDDPAHAADDLMDLVNDGAESIVLCDPFSSRAVDIGVDLGGYQFLMVPKETAKKMAVLGVP